MNCILAAYRSSEQRSLSDSNSSQYIYIRLRICLFSIEEEGTNFGLVGGGKDGGYDGRVHVDGTVVVGRRGRGGGKRSFVWWREFVAVEEDAAGA
jgi:hypothetical protein